MFKNGMGFKIIKNVNISNARYSICLKSFGHPYDYNTQKNAVYMLK